MKKNPIMEKVLFLGLCVCIVSCTPDIQWKVQMQDDLKVKKTQLPRGNWFDYEKLPMTADEREFMDFLYAYMPEADITDYSPEFHLRNVQTAMEAHREFSWGHLVPEKIFRHFVLPVRVNNEALDSSRWVFYRELKPRVEHLSMKEAVLEINHWCHERVTYQPSDGRTASPLASVRTALGRCGEESTFTVAALRAVGIPARQVYTPRWAHTDDNHAWVEAWADGQWHFLGACEPEPLLDLAWFNAPATRGMLMHTRVFGCYQDVEEIMSQTANYTEINVIENYAATALGCVRVVDAEGSPVEDARVEFKIYNYAEFYTAALKRSDAGGMATLTAGLGDMLVFASKGDLFGMQKYSFGKDDTLSLTLSHRIGETFSFPLDVTPPRESVVRLQVSPEQREANTLRLMTEDSLRKAYEATFPTIGRAVDFARENGYDTLLLPPLLVASRGNHAVLCDFLKAQPAAQKQKALWLLRAVSQKDLRDITRQNLEDHLNYSQQGGWSDSDFQHYILNPRVAGEELTPYKSFFREKIAPADAKRFRENPLTLLKWCKDSIALFEEISTVNIDISPVGLWRARVGDRRSRNILFVAMARSMGIPAWRNGVDGKLYYKQADGQTMLADFETASAAAPESGMLSATFSPTPLYDDPQYYRHYTLSKYDGFTFCLLNYGEGLSSDWSRLLKKECKLSAGYYELVTGTRLADGTVLSTLSFFNIKQGEKTTVPLYMRESTDSLMVRGSFNSELLFSPQGAAEKQSFLKAAGRGYFIVGLLEMGQEPSDHALRDIAACKEELETWGRTIVLLFPDARQLSHFNPADYPDLPATVLLGADERGEIRRAIAAEFKLQDGGRLPLLWIGDTFNRVVFFSQGYSIGLGQQLLKAVKGL